MYGYNPSIKILKFMAPLGQVKGVQAQNQGRYGHIVNIYYISENNLLSIYSRARNRKCMVRIFMKPCIKLEIRFMTHGPGIQDL